MFRINSQELSSRNGGYAYALRMQQKQKGNRSGGLWQGSIEYVGWLRQPHLFRGDTRDVGENAKKSGSHLMER